MSVTTDNAPSTVDTAKLILAVSLFVGSVFAYHYYADVSGLYRALGVVAVAAVSIGIALTTVQGRSAWSFAREARQELRKVIWPTRQEALRTTGIVVILVIIVAILLWLLDTLFSWGVAQLIVPGS